MFCRYGARHTVEKSGAYLFLPDGDASPIQIENTIVKVIEGPIFSSVIVHLPYVQHKSTLYNTPGKKKTKFLYQIFHSCEKFSDSSSINMIKYIVSEKI